MSRQHATPLLLGQLPVDSSPLRPLSFTSSDEGRIDEAYIRDLIFHHPSVLPIAEIDRQFVGAISVCTELSTPAGSIDVFLVTPSGLPIVVECKLWRNPEGRREVVGQILDYAKELSRFTSSDLQREVNRRLTRSGGTLLKLVQAVDPTIDEADFNDALTQNLRRGRFLLLIVGDGIREGTEAIAEYLQQHAGLHFTLGLVELPIFLTQEGERFVVPRVLVHTKLITHTVIAAPEGYALQILDELEEAESLTEIDPSVQDRLAFWTDFLAGLNLDDPEQQRPRASKQGWIAFNLPTSGGSSWLTIYRDNRAGEVGLFTACTRGTVGARALDRVIEDWPSFAAEIGGTAKTYVYRERPRIGDDLTVGNFADLQSRSRAVKWLQERTNTFLNVLRPRVRTAAADAAKETV